MIASLAPIQERKREILAKPGFIDDVLHEGARRARAMAQNTMAEVRERLGLLPAK